MSDRNHPDSDSSAPLDERLADLLTLYMDRVNSGEEITESKIVSEHPDDAPALIRELVSLQVLGPGEGLSRDLGQLGDYKLLRKIGQGGMGVVYEAHQVSMDRRVAVKILPSGVLGSTKALTRFIREAKIAGQLHHPNIVGVHAMGAESDSPYFAMEYVEGETLAELLSRSLGDRELSGETRRGIVTTILERFETSGVEKARPGQTAASESSESSTTPPRADDPSSVYCRRVAAAFVEVADALEHAHRKDIIHRDIKPSNLILDREGRVRILDFGLARREGQETLTLTGDILGTVLYMSPEQAMARRVPVDRRTDIYSLGATLYEMLALRPPFRGKTYQDTLSQIVVRDPKPPSQLGTGVPRDLETVVLKCLSKDPDDRYLSAEALGQDLRRFVRGDPIEARPERPVDRLWRRARRHRFKLVAASAVLVLLSLLGERSWRAYELGQAEIERDYSEWIRSANDSMQLGQLSRRQRIGILFGKLDLSEAEFAALGEEFRSTPIDAALGKLDRAVAALPDHADAYWYRGLSHQMLENHDRARADFERAIALRPKFIQAMVSYRKFLQRRGDPEAESWRGRAQAVATEGWAREWLRGMLLNAQRDFRGAAEAYGKAVEFGRDARPHEGWEARTRLRRARNLMLSKQYVEALEELAVVRASWPGSVEAALFQGRVRYLRGDEVEAEQIFEELYDQAEFEDDVALAVASFYQERRDPKREIPWLEKLRHEGIKKRLLSRAYYRLGQFDKGYRLGMEAIDLSRGDHYRWFHLALCLNNYADDHERAFPLLKKAIELDPSVLYYHAFLASIGSFLGEEKKEDVLEACQYVLAQDSIDGGDYGSLAVAFRNLGMDDEAERCYRKAGELSPDNHAVHLNYGQFLISRGRFEEAAESFGRCIQLQPRFSLGHAGKATTLRASGDLRGALEALLEATRGNPRRADHFRRIARIWMELGEPARALGALVESLDLGDSNAAMTHAMLRRILGDFRETDLGDELTTLTQILEDALESGKGEEVANTLAMAYRRQGNGPELEALIEARRAGASGDDAQERVDLANLLYSAGRHREAVQTLEQIVPFEASAKPWLRLDQMRRELYPELASYASIDERLTRTELIPDGAEWRFFRGRSEPSPALEWTELDFDDDAWDRAPAGFGMGFEFEYATRVDEMWGKCTTVYLRRRFEVEDPSELRQLILQLTLDDGCVVYLNGQELCRDNAGAVEERLSFDATARNLELPEYISRSFGPSVLRRGANVLAVQVLNASLVSGDLAFVPALVGVLNTPDVARLREDPSAPRDLLGDDAHAKNLGDYFEARVLLIEGNREAAAELLRGVVVRDPDAREPRLRLDEIEVLRTEPKSESTSGG